MIFEFVQVQLWGRRDLCKRASGKGVAEHPCKHASGCARGDRMRKWRQASKGRQMLRGLCRPQRMRQTWVPHEPGLQGVSLQATRIFRNKSLMRCSAASASREHDAAKSCQADIPFKQLGPQNS